MERKNKNTVSDFLGSLLFLLLFLIPSIIVFCLSKFVFHHRTGEAIGNAIVTFPCTCAGFCFIAFMLIPAIKARKDRKPNDPSFLYPLGDKKSGLGGIGCLSIGAIGGIIMFFVGLGDSSDWKIGLLCAGGPLLGSFLWSVIYYTFGNGSGNNHRNDSIRASANPYEIYESKKHGEAALKGELYGEWRIDDDGQHIVDFNGSRRAIDRIDMDGVLYDEFGQAHKRSSVTWEKGDDGNYYYDDY